MRIMLIAFIIHLHQQRQSKMVKNKRIKILIVLIYILILGYAIFAFFLMNKSVLEATTQVLISEYKDSKVINELVADCNTYTTNLAKVYCVNEYVFENFKYVHNDSIILNPEDTIAGGGDCKSWAAFYKLAFDKLNITSRIIYIEHHAFNVVFAEDWYCVAEQSTILCNGLDVK